MTRTTNDFLLDRLHARGVRRIFGYPGDGIDGQPVLAIVGRQATFGLGAGFQQEIDLSNLFKDVAGARSSKATPPGGKWLKRRPKE